MRASLNSCDGMRPVDSASSISASDGIVCTPLSASIDTPLSAPCAMRLMTSSVSGMSVNSSPVQWTMPSSRRSRVSKRPTTTLPLCSPMSARCQVSGSGRSRHVSAPGRNERPSPDSTPSGAATPYTGMFSSSAGISSSGTGGSSSSTTSSSTTSSSTIPTAYVSADHVSGIRSSASRSRARLRMCAFAASGSLARPIAWMAFRRSSTSAMGYEPSGSAHPLSAISLRCVVSYSRKLEATSGFMSMASTQRQLIHAAGGPTG